jgi:hypothetical protein
MTNCRRRASDGTFGANNTILCPASMSGKAAFGRGPLGAAAGIALGRCLREKPSQPLLLGIARHKMAARQGVRRWPGTGAAVFIAENRAGRRTRTYRKGNHEAV